MALSRIPQLDPSDIKLLRLFVRVVEAGGFAAAQAALNVSASTVSNQMAALETRLGLRLCDRGRVGFRLTDQGREVYAAAQRLEQALDGFSSHVGTLRGRLGGELHIGIQDSTVSDAGFRLHEAIAGLMRQENSVHVTLHVAEPAMIEAKILEGSLNIGIAAFHHHLPSVAYERAFIEEQALYCSCEHPLFDRAPSRVEATEVRAAPYVMRGYRQREAVPFSDLNVAATAYDMEAVLTLIRSHHYIGHLPVHFAEPWVTRGELAPLVPEEFSFVSHFEVAIRRACGNVQVVEAFLREFRAAHGMISSGVCDHAPTR